MSYAFLIDNLTNSRNLFSISLEKCIYIENFYLNVQKLNNSMANPYSVLHFITLLMLVSVIQSNNIEEDKIKNSNSGRDCPFSIKDTFPTLHEDINKVIHDSMEIVSRASKIIREELWRKLASNVAHKTEQVGSNENINDRNLPNESQKTAIISNSLNEDKKKEPSDIEKRNLQILSVGGRRAPRPITLSQFVNL